MESVWIFSSIISAIAEDLKCLGGWSAHKVFLTPKRLFGPSLTSNALLQLQERDCRIPTPDLNEPSSHQSSPNPQIETRQAQLKTSSHLHLADIWFGSSSNQRNPLFFRPLVHQALGIVDASRGSQGLSLAKVRRTESSRIPYQIHRNDATRNPALGGRQTGITSSMFRIDCPFSIFHCCKETLHEPTQNPPPQEKK